jgi:hypothetical protein
MTEVRPVPLSHTLSSIPDRLFWVVVRGKAVPSFNRIFAEVLRQSFGLEDFSDSLRLHQLFTGSAPNLSSFQRAVAKEAGERRKAGRVPGK